MPNLTVQAPAQQEAIRSKPFFRTNLEDGKPWLEFYRSDNDILLRFPGYADFLVAGNDSGVNCTPTPSTTGGTLEHLYRNQVIPLILSRHGNPVFHACSVEVGEFSIAFVGRSGRGKSTLAGSFAQNGHRFLADDIIVLDLNGDTYRVFPGNASIRLWPDSREHMISDTAVESAPDVSYTDKIRVLADNQLQYCNQPRALRCIFYLGDGSSSETSINPIATSDVLVQLLKHSFLLDVKDKNGLAQQFRHIARLANTPMHFHLDYPRSYRGLKELRSLILAHVMAISSGPEED